MNTRTFCGANALALMVYAAWPAHADVYSYTDNQGVLHLTDTPHDARYQLALVEPRAPVAAAPQATASTMSPLATLAGTGALQALIQAAAQKHRIVPALVHAVIQVESSFNPRAVSPKGAQGLMQLMPATAQRLGVADAFDPAQNIDGGVRYLADLMAMFKNDLRLVLAAYNAGEKAVVQYGNQIPPYRETQDYVPKVLEFYRRFQAANRRI